MGELELEPDAELPEERLGGCTSARYSWGGSPCRGSFMCRSSAMGESMMPHVRMWERLQSSQVHLASGIKTRQMKHGRSKQSLHGNHQHGLIFEFMKPSKFSFVLSR